MSKKMSFSELATAPATPAAAAVSEHVNNLATPGFTGLNDRPESSKAEIVMVGVRMTRAERRNLRAIAGQLEMPIQDILREGFALFKAKRGIS